MEQENNKKKMILPMVLGIAVLTILVLGATYAYFTVGTSNNFGSKTITATTPEIGSVALTSGESLSLNMTGELMMEENIGTYYATTTGVPSTTLTETNIATATVTGEGTFYCTYDITITPSATDSLYTAFNGMEGKAADQIVLTVNNSDYDFYNYDFSQPVTIKESFSNLTSAASQNIKASLKFKNTNANQNALQGKDITLTFTASNFSCKAVEIDPLIGKFVTLDNQPGIYYRVLYNESDTTYMLLRMNNDLGNIKYNSSKVTLTFENGIEYLQYAGSTLDTYMNETYYNTLSTNIKNAIVDKNINQKAYDRVSSVTKGDTTYTYQFEVSHRGDGNYLAVNYVTKTNVGTRHVYALEIEDIYKYMSAKKGINEREITSTEIEDMFFNSSTVDGSMWFRTVGKTSGGYVRAWLVIGSANGNTAINFLAYNTPDINARPAFLIDLSSVNYAQVDPSTVTPAQLGYITN